MPFIITGVIRRNYQEFIFSKHVAPGRFVCHIKGLLDARCHKKCIYSVKQVFALALALRATGAAADCVLLITDHSCFGLWMDFGA